MPGLADRDRQEPPVARPRTDSGPPGEPGVGLAAAAAIAESLKQTAAAATPIAVARSTVTGAMQQSARLLTGFQASAHVLVLTQEVLRAMLYIRIRFLAIAATSVIFVSAFGGANLSGAQEPEQQSGQPVGKPPPAATAQPHNRRSQRMRQNRRRPPLRGPPYASSNSPREKPKPRTRSPGQLASWPRLRPRNMTSSSIHGISPPSRAKSSSLNPTYPVPRITSSGPREGPTYVSRQISEELLKKAMFVLEQAQSKKYVLNKFTKSKTIQELRSEVERARSTSSRRR